MHAQHGPQDYQCPTCGYELHNHRATWELIPEEAREYAWETERKLPVICPVCPTPTEMAWIPTRAAHDLTSESFVIADIDGKGERRVSSLSEIRAIERESEQRHRNGDGQIVNFRAFSQDASNREVHSLAGSSYHRGASKRPDSTRTVRRGLPINVRPYRGD